ncbi:hypothetical protein [Nocardia abscessus]|uniref:hypothetical protein n=1 Tax=Nocardia abscessus TaxID=120957 RepID=UPI00245510C7|nr:hypothetical protein [Nocardia abscessus]
MLIDDETPSVVRRVVRLTGTEGGAIEAITELVVSTESKRSDTVKNSFSVALRKFSQLDTTTDPLGLVHEEVTG